jgi:tetratricopeptide (TPR) repeat protein
MVSILLMVMLLLISACRPPEIEGTVLNIKNELYDEAFVSAKSAIEKYPANAEAWFYWGWLNGEHKQNYQEMNIAFDKALELNPAQKVTYQGSSLTVKEAVEQFRQTKFAESYNSAVKIIPQAQEAEDEAKKKEILEQARDKLALAIEVYPQRVEPYRPLAMVYLNLGDTTKAESILAEAIEKNPENEALLISGGEIYGVMNDHDKSEAMFKRALELNPENAAVYQKLGIIESNRENWTAANEYYQKAIELDPDNADLTYNIGVSLYNQEKLDEAIPYFLKSIEAEPDNQVTHTILAQCYVRSENKVDDGITFLEGSVQKYPDDATLWEFLAILYGKKGMKDKADEAFQKSQVLKGN